MARRKYETAYSRHKIDQANKHAAKALANLGGAAAVSVVGLGLGGTTASLGVGIGIVAGSLAITKKMVANMRKADAKFQGARAKAFAIDHLVNHSRRNRQGGSQKQSDGAGVVKGHYSTSKSGKSFYVQQHSRKSRMA